MGAFKGFEEFLLCFQELIAYFAPSDSSGGSDDMGVFGVTEAPLQDVSHDTEWM